MLLRTAVAGLLVVLSCTASAQTVLKVFAGGPSQRPDITRQLLADYMQRNPGVRVEVETGGATSDLQRQ